MTIVHVTWTCPPDDDATLWRWSRAAWTWSGPERWGWLINAAIGPDQTDAFTAPATGGKPMPSLSSLLRACLELCTGPGDVVVLTDADLCLVPDAWDRLLATVAHWPACHCWPRDVPAVDVPVYADRIDELGDRPIGAPDAWVLPAGWLERHHTLPVDCPAYVGPWDDALLCWLWLTGGATYDGPAWCHHLDHEHLHGRQVRTWPGYAVSRDASEYYRRRLRTHPPQAVALPRTSLKDEDPRIQSAVRAAFRDGTRYQAPWRGAHPARYRVDKMPRQPNARSPDNRTHQTFMSRPPRAWPPHMRLRRREPPVS